MVLHKVCLKLIDKGLVKSFDALSCRRNERLLCKGLESICWSGNELWSIPHCEITEARIHLGKMLREIAIAKWSYVTITLALFTRKIFNVVFFMRYDEVQLANFISILCNKPKKRKASKRLPKTTKKLSFEKVGSLIALSALSRSEGHGAKTSRRNLKDLFLDIS